MQINIISSGERYAYVFVWQKERERERVTAAAEVAAAAAAFCREKPFPSHHAPLDSRWTIILPGSTLNERNAKSRRKK